MRAFNDNIIKSQSAASITSAAIPTANVLMCSAQITTTGAGNGTLKIQASNDGPQPANAGPSNWSDIPSASVSVSGAGSFLIPKTDLCYEYIRIVYTNLGTGTISVVYKSIGD